MRRVALVLFFLSGCNGEPPPSVNIAGEELVGVKLEDSHVSAFLGVPFAAPPVRGRRSLNYRLLLNQYNEELKFSLVDKAVPNRGIEKRDFTRRPLV